MVAPAGTAAQSGRLGLAATGAPSRPATATFIYTDTGGDHYWRAEAPAKVLGAKVIGIPARQVKRALGQPNSSTRLPWRVELTDANGQELTFSTMKAWSAYVKTAPAILHNSIRRVFPTVEGTVVWQRPDYVRSKLAEDMHEAGIRTVGECDDNYFADPDQNLFLQRNHFSEADRLHHARAMASQDACVFATPKLRDIYWRELKVRVDPKKIPELHVCRNHVPRADWPERVECDGPLRVGFMGSPSHVWDTSALAYTAFHTARQFGCETVCIGYSPADPDANSSGWDPGERFRNAASRHVTAKWKTVVTQHVPWVTPEEYHRVALPIDIGLAPLRTNEFNLGKSDVKMIEYAISGVAAVCSDMPVFKQAGWKNGVNCLMASKPEGFGYAVARLVRDPKLRYELVSAAQEYVASERSDDAIRREWEAVL